MDRQDLDVQMIVTAITILVFDPQIGEVHVAIEVGQIVLVRPRFDFLFITIRMAVSIRATAVALLQPLRFTQVRAVDLGVVLHLARLLELGVELLPILSIAFVPMRLEQVLAAVRQDDRNISTSLHRNSPDESFFSKMPQITGVRISFAPVMVVQVARGDHAKRSHGRQRARLGLAQGVLAVSVVDPLTLVCARQVQLAHEHVARIARFSIASVAIARVVVAIAGVVRARIIEHRTLLERPHVAACSQFWRVISDNRQRLHHLGVVSL